MENLEAVLANAKQMRQAALQELLATETAVLETEWKIACRDYGISDGCLVRIGKDFFKIVKMMEFFRPGGEKPWLYGYRRKKDGTFENHRRNLYRDWEVVTE